jgi:hypothetical protein
MSFTSVQEQIPARFGPSDGSIELARHVLPGMGRGAVGCRTNDAVTALEQLLLRFLPWCDAADLVPAQVSVLGTGIEVPVFVNGLGRRLLQVSRAAASDPPFAAPDQVVLRILLGDGAVRVDVPVEVAACGRVSIVLRILAAPLILRRRMVRDRQLEEALGGRPQTLVA